MPALDAEVRFHIHCLLLSTWIEVLFDAAALGMFHALSEQHRTALPQGAYFPTVSNMRIRSSEQGSRSRSRQSVYSVFVG
jgi:hypothetical protein